MSGLLNLVKATYLGISSVVRKVPTTAVPANETDGALLPNYGGCLQRLVRWWFIPTVIRSTLVSSSIPRGKTERIIMRKNCGTI